MNKTRFKRIKKEWDEIDDKERWEWLKENQSYGFIVNLDNDDTFVTHPGIEDDEGDYVMYFDEFIGWSDGVQSLLDAINIRNECV